MLVGFSPTSHCRQHALSGSYLNQRRRKETVGYTSHQDAQQPAALPPTLTDCFCLQRNSEKCSLLPSCFDEREPATMPVLSGALRVTCSSLARLQVVEYVGGPWPRYQEYLQSQANYQHRNLHALLLLRKQVLRQWVSFLRCHQPRWLLIACYRLRFLEKSHLLARRTYYRRNHE